MRTALVGIAFTVLSAAACSEDPSGHGCAGVGLALIKPSDTTIAVGQSFVARYYEGGYCAGMENSTTRLARVPVSWHTLDTLIINVDAASGRVIGQAVGDAVIKATGFDETSVRVR